MQIISLLFSYYFHGNLDFMQFEESKLLKTTAFNLYIIFSFGALNQNELFFLKLLEKKKKKKTLFF